MRQKSKSWAAVLGGVDKIDNHVIAIFVLYSWASAPVSGCGIAVEGVADA